ncbi:MAG: aldolase/citrate lyase family protein [Desulfobacterales bacterium]
MMMKFIRGRVLSGEFMAGAWCNLGSSLTAEIAARKGYDWILFDQEHGPGDSMTLLHQIQAVEAWPAAPLVRIAWNEMPRFKRALDLGACGIIVPYVQTREEAEYAAASMRYTPEGLRGVASSPRATGFAGDFEEYYAAANDNLLTVVQIETGKTLDNLNDIAAVKGVDVLFVGPLDLSTSLNTPNQFEDERFIEALKAVGRTAKEKGKAAGILLPKADWLDLVTDFGFSFVAIGADGGMVSSGFAKSLEALSAKKKI